MIKLNGDQLALINAAFARVAKSEAHKFVVDASLQEIADAVGGKETYINVYDVGKLGEKTRYLQFDFGNDSIEFLVGPQPELKPIVDTRPEGDGPPPGTPGAAFATALAA